MIVILDNRDSFVHNVEHRLAELGVASRVVPSHATRLDEIAALQPTGLVISPGPQGPDEAGISTAAIRTFGRDVPVLGICLGHQCIAVAFGVPVRPDTRACHGRASPIAHDGAGLLAGLPDAVRRGSLPRAGGRRARAGRRARRLRAAGRRSARPGDGRPPPHAAGRGRAVPPGERADAGRLRDPGQPRPAQRGTTSTRAMVERLAVAARRVLEPAA